MCLSLHFHLPIHSLLRFSSSLLFVLDFATLFFLLETKHIELNRKRHLIHLIHQTKMRRCDVVSQIFIILSIINFALAAPVLVQEKCQACLDVVYNHEDATTVLGKRMDEIEEIWRVIDNYFPKPESSVSAPLKLDHGATNVVDGPPPNPATPTPDHGATNVVDGSPPNPAMSTESDRESMGVHAPSSSPVLESWFNPHDESMGAHAPRPNPGPSTEFGSNDRLVVSEPPSPTRGSPTGFGSDHEYEMVQPPSSGQLSRTELNMDHEYEMVPPPPGAVSPTVSEHAPRSMSAESQLKNVQTVGDAEKGKAKDSRFSGTSRDVVNAAQRELQSERSLDPESKFLSRPSLFYQPSNNYSNFVILD